MSAEAELDISASRNSLVFVGPVDTEAVSKSCYKLLKSLV